MDDGAFSVAVKKTASDKSSSHGQTCGLAELPSVKK
jgi:hypothetical protein